MYKLNFYVPEAYLQTVKNALFQAGAGRYQAYDHCCWQVRGEGQFRPLASSQPFIGQQGQLETLPEFKVEMICTASVIKEVINTLLSVHPYEEPAYDICKILTLNDL